MSRLYINTAFVLLNESNNVTKLKNCTLSVFVYSIFPHKNKKYLKDLSFNSNLPVVKYLFTKQISNTNFPLHLIFLVFAISHGTCSITRIQYLQYAGKARCYCIIGCDNIYVRSRYLYRYFERIRTVFALIQRLDIANRHVTLL